MKKILVIVMLIFAFGCSDDVTEPSKDTIVGKWSKDLRDIKGLENFILILEFSENGEYFSSNALGDSDSKIFEGTYTFADNIITLKDSKCKEVEGKYELEFIGNIVDFKLIKDECDRANYIEGAFVKYVEGPKG